VNLSDDILATILMALFSSIFGIVTAFLSSRFYANQTKADLKKEFESRFNEKKWSAYTGFAKLMGKVLKNVRAKKLNDTTQAQVASEMQDFISELWLVGSDDVIDAVIAWQQFAREHANKEAPSSEVIFKMAAILIEMRKDLGYTSSQISPRDLVVTFIHDIDNATISK
jgi:hypothetical protein